VSRVCGDSNADSFMPTIYLSDGMDQQEADDKHHRAGYAMN
jgi:hypothetical protein